ncbi:hypothetical protein CK226_17120 [Mesorhizobium sp. WSM4311]|nr:hypothetical protein CK232_12560 [Mesorhizobium sp. WSM4304]PBB75924.1 hypothetical protein CK227_10095 [Mesorhizobium sp. WSM4308]PBC21409.1 hypothetical protein CK226_17120 [Mesorhizobium sp. WSM4311]
MLIIGDESSLTLPLVLPESTRLTLPLVGRVDEWMLRSGSQSAGWGYWREPEDPTPLRFADRPSP